MCNRELNRVTTEAKIAAEREVQQADEWPPDGKFRRHRTIIQPLQDAHEWKMALLLWWLDSDHMKSSVVAPGTAGIVSTLQVLGAPRSKFPLNFLRQPSRSRGELNFCRDRDVYRSCRGRKKCFFSKLCNGIRIHCHSVNRNEQACNYCRELTGLCLCTSISLDIRNAGRTRFFVKWL